MNAAADTWSDIWKSEHYNQEKIIYAHEEAMKLAEGMEATGDPVVSTI